MQVTVSCAMAIIGSSFSCLETKHTYRQDLNVLVGLKSTQKHAQRDCSIQHIKTVCTKKKFLLFSNLSQILLPIVLGHVVMCCMTWRDIASEQLAQHCFSPLQRGAWDAWAATALVTDSSLLPAVRQVTHALKHLHSTADCSLCGSLGKVFF